MHSSMCGHGAGTVGAISCTNHEHAYIGTDADAEVAHDVGLHVRLRHGVKQGRGRAGDQRVHR